MLQQFEMSNKINPNEFEEEEYVDPEQKLKELE
jgi:hypothetical protein